MICMNKKLISLVVMLCIGASCYATPNDRLRIRIKASEFSDCILIDQFINGGHVSDHTTIPTMIFRGTTGTFSVRSSSKSLANVILTYACGDNMSVTFLSGQKHLGKESSYKFTIGKVLKIQGMQVDLKSSDDDLQAGNLARTMYWTFKDGCPCCA